ncbi:MAG: hypothetical protein PHH98_04925 [Candidatus Gracilibacteria bacterium]|nr:hypothetical protein [Candidatus Gracilibacteria bacterium]
MKKIYINKSGYSVILSILLIGFLMVLSIGILRLILNEMNSNSAMGDYIKAYAGAESAQELALLDIKNKGYGYDYKIEDDVNNKSVLISENPLNKSLYHPKKDVLISYFNNGKVNNYDGELSPLGYDIIPLFYIDDSGEKKVNDISITVSIGDSDDLSWNVVGKNDGISGIGTNLTGTKKLLTTSGFTIEDKTIGEFLSGSDTNYLVLFNAGNTNNISYNIKSTNSLEFFTKPRLDIISTGEVGSYKQNLKTTVDNTKFLNILKYSIYSN